jgi:hypothetical protein
VVEPAPGVREEVLRLFLLGPALAVLLYQRGLLVLHASAVAMDGGVVAFLGGSGWGKSTIAASLHQRGYSLVADDAVAVQIEGDRITAWPGYPRIKVWPDTALALGHPEESLPRLHPQGEKRDLRVSGGAPQAALPLRCLYVLEEGPHYEIASYGKQQAWMELVRHSYGIRLRHAVDAAAHFSRCVTLAKAVPVRRLIRPRDFSALSALVRLVEADGVPTGC